MKLIRLFPILLVIGLSCLTSCQKEDIPYANNERTLFMYLPWSTNLTSYFYQNIDDMEDAISPQRAGQGASARLSIYQFHGSRTV